MFSRCFFPFFWEAMEIMESQTMLGTDPVLHMCTVFILVLGVVYVLFFVYLNLQVSSSTTHGTRVAKLNAFHRICYFEVFEVWIFQI